MLSNPKTQSGFSLLEALIASTIFAAVLLVASSAFKFFMSAGERNVNSQLVMKEAMEVIKIRDAIKGTYHYYIRENAISNAKPSLFFQGNVKGFTSITTNSIDFNHVPTRITVSEIENNSMTDLVYCEYDNRQAFPAREITSRCDSPLVIAHNIKSLKFSYFGWSSLNNLYEVDIQSNSINNLSNKTWSDVWDAGLRKILPQFIKIDIEYKNQALPYKPTQLWFRISDADPVQFNVNNPNNNG